MSAALINRDKAERFNDLRAYQVANAEWRRLAYEDDDLLYDLGVFIGEWSAGCFVVSGGIAAVSRRRIRSLDL